MVRQRSRNTLQEVYGTKFDAAKTQANANNNKNLKDHGYIITSNTPYSTATALPPPTPSGQVAANNTSRRKSARPNMKNVGGTATKCPGSHEEKDDNKKELSTKMKTTRGGSNEKWQYEASRQYDNKTYRAQNDARKDTQAHGDGQQHNERNHSLQSTRNNHHHNQHHHQHHHQQHQNHQHHHHHHDEDKDDDTEEFFELIRQTVESAIGKSVYDLLNRNFRELGAKVDRFSAELKSTNETLNKMQMDLNNRIVHYGEENSRHFRYLCMKSEYDKMFYQHQTLITTQAASTDPAQQPPPEKKVSATRASSSTPPRKNSKEIVNDAPCTCRSSINQATAVNSNDPHKSSSDENNISQKSSDVGMRDILDHIQRFCAHMSEKKNGRPSGSNGTYKNNNNSTAADSLGFVKLIEGYMRENGGPNINQQIFREINIDDDDLELSSDGMTPRSEDDFQMANYGGMTKRADSSRRIGSCGAGGGDGDA